MVHRDGERVPSQFLYVLNAHVLEHQDELGFSNPITAGSTHLVVPVAIEQVVINHRVGYERIENGDVYLVQLVELDAGTVWLYPNRFKIISHEFSNKSLPCILIRDE